MAPPQEWNIIATDYNSYSVVHSCSLSMGFLKKEQFYMLSRCANDESDCDRRFEDIKSDAMDLISDKIDSSGTFLNQDTDLIS